MKLRLTLVTTVSMMLMLAGLYLALTGNQTVAGKQVFFTMTGILGWLIGNKLVELEQRLDAFEKKNAGPEPVPGVQGQKVIA